MMNPLLLCRRPVRILDVDADRNWEQMDEVCGAPKCR